MKTITLLSCLALSTTMFSQTGVLDVTISVNYNSALTVQTDIRHTIEFNQTGADLWDSGDQGNLNTIGDPGDNVYPFTLNTNGEVVTIMDARPEFNKHKIVPLGFLAKNPCTITFSGYSMLQPPTMSTMINNFPVFHLYLEETATGVYYDLSDSSATINIPANLSYNAAYQLHIVPKLNISPVDESCHNTLDGSLYIRNNNMSNWNLSLYKDSVMTFNGTVSSTDTTFGSLSGGTYSMVYKYGNIVIDSSVVALATPSQVTAAFNVSNMTPALNETVSFTNLSTNVTTHLWDFGDGNTDTSYFATHSYAVAGSYNVTLIETHNGVCSDSQTMTITVGASVIANHDPRNTMYTNRTPDQMGENNALQVFASDSKTLNVASSNSEIKNVNVYSVSGQLITAVPCTGNSISITLENTGAYIVVVEYVNGAVETKKAVL